MPSLPPAPARPVRLAALAAAALLALTACGGEPATGDSAGSREAEGFAINTSPEQDRVRAQAVPEIAELVPEEIRESGELVVGVSGTGGVPLAFFADDDETIIGSEPDIAQLVADVLDLDLRLEVTSWDNLLLSVESGQYDVGISNITVTEERKEIFDFATYRVDSLSFEARADSDITVRDRTDVAGLSIAVDAGTNQEEILVGWDEENQADGLEPVDFQYYTNPSDYYLALRSGRIDLHFGPTPMVSYHVAAAQESTIVGEVPGGGDLPAEIAATTQKGNGLVEPLSQALNTVIENGRYAEVLARWGIEADTIPESEINPPGLPARED
ncbi:ABC transporter substrate-binding protein [Marinitenerispora sediminis]|nr:ABC transporter substrate-binding protein [Marinitenerispora sediminis]RCV55017.1 ABC transporter substrate-binding protein [Marinitenerispora sediminis]